MRTRWFVAGGDPSLTNILTPSTNFSERKSFWLDIYMFDCSVTPALVGLYI